MKKVVGACDICKRQFTAIHEIGLKKIIASHKSVVHGIRGFFSGSNELSPQAKRDRDLVYYYLRSGTAPKSARGIRVMAEYQRQQAMQQPQRPQKKRRYVARRQPQLTTPTETKPAVVPAQAEPAYHCECPRCHTRFYMVGGDQK